MVCRRTVLRSLPAVSAVGLAGCLSRSDEFALREFRLINDTDRERTVEVRIEADGETVSTATYTVPQSVPNETTAVQVECDWPLGVSNYRIALRVDDASEWTYEPDLRDELCLDVRIHSETDLRAQLATPCPTPGEIEALESGCVGDSER